MGERRAKNLLVRHGPLNNAEEYCRHHRVPLSRLIEDFLETLPRYHEREITSPIVRRLNGAIGPFSSREDEEYRDFLYGVKERKRPPRTSYD